MPPRYPGTNNVETVMKPLGKAMKIGLHTTTKSEKEILNSFLVNYRGTPHLSTGRAPGGMLLRDRFKYAFPGKTIGQSEIRSARGRDFVKKK